MSNGHARFSPSNMFRILGCPGHLQAVEALPVTERDSGDSIHSRRGTCCHTVSEMVLNTYKETDKLVDQEDFLGQEIENVIVDEDIVSISREYTNYCINRIEFDGADYFEAEVKLDLETWEPILDYGGVDGSDIGGTMDFIATFKKDSKVKLRLLEIADLKSGKGVVVEVEDNPQALTYALCALEKYGFDAFDTIRITIAQPPADHPDGTIRSKDYTPQEVWDWGVNTMLEGVKLAISKNPPFYPSQKNCKFCPMDGRCEAQYEHSIANALVEFEDLLDTPAVPYQAEPKAHFPDILSLTPEQELLILNEGTAIINFINAVHSRAKEKALLGEIPLEYKLVAKRANRKYKDSSTDKQIHKALGKLGLRPHDYTEMPKTKSPSQVETALKARGVKPENLVKFMEAFVYKPDNGYNLVHSSAKGKALPPPIEAEFADLFDDEEDDLL